MLNKTKIELRSEEYYYKICMDKILEFIHQCKYQSDSDNYMMESFTVNHYTLAQFQKWVGKRMTKRRISKK